MLVVLWHANPPVWMGKFIMFFCVPLFFFTSGYFFKPKGQLKDLLLFFRKRIKKLYIPFVCWSLVFLFLHNTFVHLHLYTQPYSHEEIIQRLIGITTKLAYQDTLAGPLWFVSALFFVSVFMGIITYVLEKSKIHYTSPLLIILLIVAIVSKYYINANHYMPQIAMYSFGACFFLSGHIYKNMNFTLTRIIALCCIVVLLAATILYDRVVEMVNYTYYDVVPYYVLAICGTLITFFFSDMLLKTKLKSFLIYCGNHTMIILALHCLSFKLVSLFKIHVYGMNHDCLSEHPVITEHNQLFFLLYFLVGIAVPLLVYLLYDSILTTSSTSTKE